MSPKTNKWLHRPIDSLCDVVRGSSPRPARDPRFFDGDFLPWVTVAEVTSSQRMHLESTKAKLTEEGSKQTRILESGTVILTNSGATLGVPKILNIRAGANDGIAAFLNLKEIEPEFLYFVLQSRTEYMRSSLAPGVGQPNLNTEIIGEIRVPVPAASEQVKIAAVLGTWDRAIEFTEQLVVARHKCRQALMQQLLTGEVRLQAYTKRKRKKPSHIVHIPAAVRRGIYPPSVQPGIPNLIQKPDGWNEKTMAELLNTQKRRVHLNDDAEYDLVVARRNRGGIEPRGKLRGEEIRTTTQFKVKTGDFVISRRQIIHGACGIVPPSLDGAVVSNEYSVFTVNEHLDPGYLRLLSHSLYFQQTCFHSSVGVAVEKMIFKVEQWLKYPFLLPPIEEQREITNTLETAEREIDLLKQRVGKLKQQKKGLMQQLLTGKIRVKLPKGAAK